MRECFAVLGNIVDNYKLGATSTFNMDETVSSTVRKPQKVLALCGKHEVGAVSIEERGTNCTGVCCMNAAWMFVHPLLIFKALSMNCLKTLLLLLNLHVWRADGSHLKYLRNDSSIA
jgi:hypothetical protein